jgi:hypothetical protein
MNTKVIRGDNNATKDALHCISTTLAETIVKQGYYLIVTIESHIGTTADSEPKGQPVAPEARRR